MKKVVVFQLAVVLMLLILGPSSANATMGLRLFDNLGNCVEVTNPGAAATHCGGSNTSGNGTINSFSISPNGKVTVDASLGVWIVNVTTGLTKPILGSPQAPDMDLNTSDTSSGAGQLTIQWSDTGFEAIPGYADAVASGTFKRLTTTSLTYKTFTDVGNTLYGNANPMTSQTFTPLTQGCVSGANCSFSGDTQGGSIQSEPYELMQQLVFVASGADNWSGDFEVTIVPEPASVALLGGILLFTATVIRRRFKNV